MADPVRARESRASRLERLSFALAFGVAGSAAVVLLVAPTLIVLISSFTSAYSLKFPPRVTPRAGTWPCGTTRRRSWRRRS